MDQFIGIDVKIEMPNNMTKRVKTPLSFEALFSQVRTLAAAKGIAEPLAIRYVDLDGESVVIEDDTDLEMAYTCALSSDKKIKFIVDQPQGQPQQAAPQKDIEMVQ